MLDGNFKHCFRLCISTVLKIVLRETSRYVSILMTKIAIRGCGGLPVHIFMDHSETIVDMFRKAWVWHRSIHARSYVFEVRAEYESRKKNRRLEVIPLHSLHTPSSYCIVHKKADGDSLFILP